MDIFASRGGIDVGTGTPGGDLGWDFTRDPALGPQGVGINLCLSVVLDLFGPLAKMSLNILIKEYIGGHFCESGGGLNRHPGGDLGYFIRDPALGPQGVEISLCLSVVLKVFGLILAKMSLNILIKESIGGHFCESRGIDVGTPGGTLDGSSRGIPRWGPGELK